MMGISNKALNMEKDVCLWIMEIVMMDGGLMMKFVAAEDTFLWMVINLKDNFIKEKDMGMVHILIIMVTIMKDNGEMI